MNPDLSSSEPNAIVAAVIWLQSALTGSLAISVAIIAVGSFGLMLMLGRLPSRRGAQLILACSFIFGAAPIAVGIVRGITRSEPEIAPVPMQSSPIVPPADQRPSRVQPYDPYAGAAMPPRR